MTVAQKDDYWIFGVQDVRRVRSKSSAMVLDSGAELHVCPGNFHELAGTTSKVPGRDLIGIGGDSLNYQGERRVMTTLTDENDTKIPAVVNFAVADVTNAVLSLGLMVDAGMEFLFSKNRGCWMSKDVFDVGKLALEIDGTATLSWFTRRTEKSDQKEIVHMSWRQPRTRRT